MPLQHVHLTARLGQKPASHFASVDSGLVGISTHGGTPLWSTGFSGCIGLVMCGAGNWGALVHLNQAIQDPGKDLALALDVSKRFVCDRLNVGGVTDVLIFYGDPLVNLGQTLNLTAHEIRRRLGCERVIDLRRYKKGTTPYGSDFVYVPATQTVYTAARTDSTALEEAGFGDGDELNPKPTVDRNFPYQDGQRARLTPGLGHKGSFEVP